VLVRFMCVQLCVAEGKDGNEEDERDGARERERVSALFCSGRSRLVCILLRLS